MDFRASRGVSREKDSTTTTTGSPLSESTETGRLRRPAQGRSFGTFVVFGLLEKASTVAEKGTELARVLGRAKRRVEGRLSLSLSIDLSAATARQSDQASRQKRNTRLQFPLPWAAVSRGSSLLKMLAVPISRLTSSSAARNWRLARADRANLGPKRESKKRTSIAPAAGGCGSKHTFFKAIGTLFLFFPSFDLSL